MGHGRQVRNIYRDEAHMLLKYLPEFFMNLSLFVCGGKGLTHLFLFRWVRQIASCLEHPKA